MIHYLAFVNIDGPAITDLETADTKLEKAMKADPSTSGKQQSSQKSMRPETAAGITLAVTAFAGLLIAVAVIGCRKRKQQITRSRLPGAYGTIDESSGNEAGL